MQSSKRVLSGVLVFVLALTLLPAAASADSVTWDEVLSQYPDHELQDFVLPLPVTQGFRWSGVVSQLSSGTEVTVRIFSAGGIQINILTNDLPICTAQHASVVLASDTRGANLLQVIVLGDVLGNGQLLITQLTRLAAALSGSRPLEGLYYKAGDINGNGKIDIGDVVMLSRWLTEK